jgi:hypothetical protein
MFDISTLTDADFAALVKAIPAERKRRWTKAIHDSLRGLGLYMRGQIEVEHFEDGESAYIDLAIPHPRRVA